MLGRFATGLSKNFSAPPSSSKPGKTFYPDIEKHRIYMRQFAIFRALYLALEKEFPKLADL
jgi:hypothetical protein